MGRQYAELSSHCAKEGEIMAPVSCEQRWDCIAIEEPGWTPKTAGKLVVKTPLSLCAVRAKEPPNEPRGGQGMP